MGQSRFSQASISFTVVFIFSSCLSVAQAKKLEKTVSIVAQPLYSALNEVAEQMNLQLLADPQLVEGKNAPALNGKFTANQALGRLLSGSGLTTEISGNDVVVKKIEINNLGSIEKNSDVTVLSPVLAESESVGLSTVVQANRGMVSVVKKEEIEAIRPRKLEDFNAIIPGFSSVGFLNGGNRSIFMRGIGAMHDMNGTSVAVTVDGIPQDSLELQNPYITENIDSIEFFKTSQQVLYGKTGQAGAINIRTRKPTKSGGVLTLGIGNNGYQKAGIGYDYVPSETFRVGGFFDVSKDAGWVKNTYLNKKFLGYDNKNYKLETAWMPTPNSELALSIFGFRTHEDGPLKTAVDPKSYRPINGSHLVLPSGKSHEIPFWEIYQDTTPFWDREMKGGTFKVAHKFHNNIEFSSVTSYKKYEHDFITDLDATVQYDGYESTLAQQYDYRYLTQSLQLKDESGDKFKWIIGATGYKNKFIIDPGTYTNRYVADMSNWQQHKGYGIFGQFMWSPVSELDLLFGLRYQIDRVHAKMIVGSDSNTHTDRTFLFSFTPTWNITDNQHLYFTVAKNYAPSMITGFSNLSLINKENGMNYEIGYTGKWLDGRLSTSVALFMNDIKNRQVENPATYLYANLGREISKGFEISAEYQVSDNFLIGATYTKFSPKMVEYIGYPEKRNLIAAFVPLSQGGIHVESKYESPLGLIQSRLDIKYTGKSYGDRDNKAVNKAYTLVDLNVSLKRENHEFTLWAKNILNKKYYNSVFDYAIFPGYNATYGRGRSFGLDYKYRF